MKLHGYLFMMIGCVLFYLGETIFTNGTNAQQLKPYPLYENNAVPIGSIVAWPNTFPNMPPLPKFWVECDGQVLNNINSPFHGQIIPDLNKQYRYLRGNTISGGTGGQATHSLTSGKFDTHSTYTVSKIDGKYQGSITNEPPYYDVVWIMKVE